MLHGPKEALLPKEWTEFTKTANLPDDHGWHIHNLLPTYRVKVRGTKEQLDHAHRQRRADRLQESRKFAPWPRATATRAMS